MSSGMGAEGGEQIAVPAEGGPGFVPEGDHLGAVEALSAAGAGAAGATGGGAGARALTAVEARQRLRETRCAAAE